MSNVFVILVWGCELLGGWPQKAAFLSYHIKGAHSQHGSTVLATGHLAAVVFVRLLPVKLFFFSLSHTLLFGRKSLCSAHTSRIGVMFYFLEDGVCAWIIWTCSTLICLFAPFIYISMNLWICFVQKWFSFGQWNPFT